MLTIIIIIIKLAQANLIRNFFLISKKLHTSTVPAPVLQVNAAYGTSLERITDLTGSRTEIDDTSGEAHTYVDECKRDSGPYCEIVDYIGANPGPMMMHD